MTHFPPFGPVFFAGLRDGSHSSSGHRKYRGNMLTCKTCAAFSTERAHGKSEMPKKTTLIRGLELMIDLFKVIYGWWALHLFSMFFFFSGDLRLGDFPPQFDLLETHQDDQEGADFQIASFFHIHSHMWWRSLCHSGFRLVHSQVMLTSFFKVFLPEIFFNPLMIDECWWMTLDPMDIHGHRSRSIPIFSPPPSLYGLSRL